jgi:hypothetical protein
VKHPNFDFMHCIYFSQFVFDEFIAKGGEIVHKVVKLFYNQVVERCLWKHDKLYQRGGLALRKLGRVLCFSLPFHLSFVAFLPILRFCCFLFLDDHFEPFFGFWSFR